METSYVAAQAFSGADLMHGPMAMLQESSAVLAFVNHGTGGRAMQPVLQRLRELETSLTTIGVGDLPLPETDEALARHCWRSCRCSCSRTAWLSPGASTRTNLAACAR